MFTQTEGGAGARGFGLKEKAREMMISTAYSPAPVVAGCLEAYGRSQATALHCRVMPSEDPGRSPCPCQGRC